MLAKSIKGTHLDEIKQGLNDAIKDGFQPTLATLFISKDQDIKGVCEILDQAGITIFGATTGGEFIDENLSQKSTVILLLDMPKKSFYIHYEALNGKDDRAICQKIGTEALEKFQKPVFLIKGSHLETNAEELLGGFSDSVGEDVTIFGAMAGDDFTNTQQYVISNDILSARGILSLVMEGEKIKLAGRATSAWKAIGTEKTVTKSEGNRVYTIDHQPALDITAKYGGLTDLNPKNQSLVFDVITSCALQLQREKGDPVMRPGLQIIWDDHSFICSGKVPQGSKIRFSLPPDFDVVEKVIAGCQDIKDHEMPEADALIVFSCLGRYFALGPLISEEIRGLKEVWSVPMAGFFCNAELGPATGGGLEMHNLTCITVAIKEL